MNERKDIFESVKYIMKEEIDTKINCSNLARCRDCSVLCDEGVQFCCVTVK